MRRRCEFPTSPGTLRLMLGRLDCALHSSCSPRDHANGTPVPLPRITGSQHLSPCGVDLQDHERSVAGHADCTCRENADRRQPGDRRFPLRCRTGDDPVTPSDTARLRSMTGVPTGPGFPLGFLELFGYFFVHRERATKEAGFHNGSSASCCSWTGSQEA